MAVYLDLIWLLNFFIDLLLLKLTAIIMKRETSRVRLAAGAFIASFYIFFLFIPAAAFMLNPAVKGLYSAVIILAAFRFNHIRIFIQTLFMFYFVSFSAGGGLTGLHYFFQLDQDFIQGTFATYQYSFGTPVSWLFVIIGFPAVYHFTRKRLEKVEAVKLHYEHIMMCKITVPGTEVILRGLVDTGNQLSDPMTGKPVLVIDMKQAGDKFPKELRNLVNAIPSAKMDIPEQFANRLSLVPFRTVGSSGQFIWTIRPDDVTVETDGKVYSCRNVLIGLSTNQIAERGEYECLLHPGMFKQEKTATPG